jgi:ACR3 family arsenite transporter
MAVADTADASSKIAVTPAPALELAGSPAPAAKQASEAISFFEKWLTLWVALCMVGGGLIGAFAPAAAHALETATVAGVNGIIAALLWVMLFPMFVTLDFTALRRVAEAPAAVVLTTVLSYAIKPFTMFGLAVLFTRVFYVRVMPDADLRDSYVAGLVLLAGAPCTAMVFVWSALMGGSTADTLLMVGVNDLLMLALYVPICGLLIGSTSLALPWATIAASVAFFVLGPLLLAVAVRSAVLNFRDERFLLDRIVAPIKPLTTVALLATLVIIFVFQGTSIRENVQDIFLLAVPILIQCVLLWAICYGACFHFCIPHVRAGPASLIATSNFFELAVAVAVSVYGPKSGAALATVVGVLVEVPIMLLFTYIVNYLKPTLDSRCAACADVCPSYAKVAAPALREAAAPECAYKSGGGGGGNDASKSTPAGAEAGAKTGAETSAPCCADGKC